MLPNQKIKARIAQNILLLGAMLDPSHIIRVRKQEWKYGRNRDNAFATHVNLLKFGRTKIKIGSTVKFNALQDFPFRVPKDKNRQVFWSRPITSYDNHPKTNFTNSF